MSNLSITDHFIGPADLVTDMENYAVHMNSLCYDKKDDNVYNALPPEYHDFADIFQAADKQSLPERGPHNHAIDLEPEQQPPFGKLYSMSPAELDVLKVYLNNAVKAGIICKLISPAASPVMFVPKSDGSLRLVIDYRGLNDITIKNRYPLPLISDMLDRLQGAKKFTKLDCKDAYNRVRIKGGDEWKTAFRTRFRLFEYLAMPFGLTNTPATFQAFIDKALGEFLDITWVMYLDNILIFSKNESDHEDHVQQVLAALQRYDLHLKISKCSFNTTEVNFLDFRINTEGIFMDPERIRAVEEWLPPQDNYSRIAAPLLNLLKTGKNKKEIGVKVRQTTVVPVVPAPFPLSETALEAFKTLKEAFTSAPLLQYFDENKPMRVETDASAFAIGRTLTQQFEIDGHLHWLPVAYYSKKLLDMETQYGTGEQELLAIVEAMHHWRHYCQGARHPIVVLTDYANLVWFMTTPNLTRRQLKWAEKLAERPDYELPKASTTLTAAEMVRQSFRLGSNNYKPVQEKLYTLAVMTLRPRRPVRQVQQEDVVPNTNIEDGGTTEAPSVRHLPAQETSCVGGDLVRQDNVVPDTNMDVGMDSGTTEAPLVRRLPAREASRVGGDLVRQDNVILDTNMDVGMDGGATEAPSVRCLPAREASRIGGDLVRQDNVVPDTNMDVGMDGGTTEAPSVRRLPAREASRIGGDLVRRDNVVPDTNMDVRIDGGATEAPLVRRLPA
ncbi:retrotransposon nucleocapsid protein [Lasallia pustulata]|uniref:Retrotransposon nucleocapsid protein n=1 Tax=Lasallia pustulata TaxID=136370 RepID=A0A1W5D2R1_9LECA|nr:retrotransposon nucleocapsid protein [Lasallia pustulata]